MNKIKKILILLAIFACFFILIGSVSGSKYVVNKTTKESDLVKIISNCQDGDIIDFNTDYYTLTDTLVVDKAITFKSNYNTLFNLNNNKAMFKINSDGVTISGLNLNFKGKGSSNKHVGAITSSKTVIYRLNIEDTYILVDNNYADAVLFDSAQINFNKCTITTQGSNNFGLYLKNWIGDFTNSKITTQGKNSLPIYSYNSWTGKIANSKLYNTGKANNPGFASVNSQGTITNSKISSKNSYALMISDNVKVTKSTLTSKKGMAKIFRYRPDLWIYNGINKKNNTYTFRVYNIGFLPSNVKTDLVLKTGTITKRAIINTLESGALTTINITLPKKYANNKYTKVLMIDYSKKVLESDEKNNVIKFKV